MFSGERINGKGSDLYQLCTELDDIIARKSNAVRLYCIDGNQTSSHFECSVSVSVLRYWCASFVRYSITFLHYIYALLERDQNAPSSQLPESADWIPDGFWDNKSSTQYDAVDIKSSEKQLTRELIATLLLQHCSLYSGCRFILYILAMYKYKHLYMILLSDMLEDCQHLVEAADEKLLSEMTHSATYMTDLPSWRHMTTLRWHDFSVFLNCYQPPIVMKQPSCVQYHHLYDDVFTCKTLWMERVCASGIFCRQLLTGTLRRGMLSLALILNCWWTFWLQLKTTFFGMCVFNHS